MESDFFITGGVAIVCLVYSILILILFLMKKKSNKISTTLYFILLVCTVLSIAFYVLNSYISVKGFSYALYTARFLSFTICVWEFLFMLYVTFGFNTDEDNRIIFDKHKKLIIVLNILMVIVNAILSVVLDIKYVKKGDGLPLGLGGSLMTYFNILGVLAIVYTLIVMIIKRKRVNKHAAVLFSFAIVGSVFSFLLEIIIHEPVNDVPFSQAIVIFFLYLSLESQDASLLDAYNKAIEDERELDKLKSEFILGMSHKLRTPMNVILGLSDSILSNDSDDIKDDLYNINLSSNKLLNLVNSILDLSSLQSNKELLNMQNYKFEKLIYDLSSNINSKLKENLIFNINVDEICPNDLYGDDYKLSRILNIIIMNAINHTEYGEVSLNVSCIQIDSSNYEFQFLIKNTGHAMKQELFDITFEDLVKLNNSGNSVIDTDSLKLIVCKSLLELIGGSIEFINETGKGTQYIIKLKQKITSDNRIGSIKERIQLNHVISHDVKNLLGKRILIVDNNKVNITILKRLLGKYSCNVENVLNPKDAIELIGVNNYDLIFYGNDIDDKRGEDFVRGLESTGNRVPNIIGIVNQNGNYSYYNDVIMCPIDFKGLNTVINKYFS